MELPAFHFAHVIILHSIPRDAVTGSVRWVVLDFGLPASWITNMYFTGYLRVPLFHVYGSGFELPCSWTSTCPHYEQVQLEPTSTRLGATGTTHAISKYTGILQATKDIIREEGLLGLWRGNVPALLLVMPYTAIQFVVLQKFKSVAARYSDGDKNPGHLGAGIAYVSGAVAGTAATIGSYPFDLLRTILASQGEPKVYPTMRSAFMEILRSRGITGLYAGLTPSLVEIVPYAGLQFGFYDTFKRWASVWNEKRGSPKDPHAEHLSPVQHFVCGLGAGTFAKVCCHPLDVVKKRFQVEGLQRHPRYGAMIETKKYKNMKDAITRIVEHEGLAGLYKGTLPSVVKAAPAAAITFVVYEYIAAQLQDYWINRIRA